MIASAVHSVVTIAIYAGLIALTIPCVYLFALAAVFVSTKRKISDTSPPGRQMRFAFIVPAHNEEAWIADTIRSLMAVDYPDSLFTVVVIADNCTDGTAKQAVKEGAECLERFDEREKGKGYALRFAFNRLLSKEYDAFVVIDADSIVSRNFLRDLDRRFRNGDRVIQAYDGLSNPNTSVLTYLFQVGNLIENRLFWEPKDLLHLPVLLRGNGMCFSKEILLQNRWESFSIVEDTEYSMILIEHGVPIRFAPEIGVYARQPENLQQAHVQRARWSSGNATFTKSRAIGLILKGLAQRDLTSFDLGMTLISTSKPLLLATSVALVVGAITVNSIIAMCWSTVLLLGQLSYLFMGIIMNGISITKCRLFLISPLYLAWLCMISILGLAGYRKGLWARTSRTTCQ